MTLREKVDAPTFEKWPDGAWTTATERQAFTMGWDKALALTEADARERERKAFVAGGSWQESNTDADGLDFPMLDDRKAEAARRYP
jgi:hypothetical protein